MRNEVKAREFNILVVEDDERTFQTIKESLINPEYKLHRVTTGQEALNLAKRVILWRLLRRCRSAI